MNNNNYLNQKILGYIHHNSCSGTITNHKNYIQFPPIILTCDPNNPSISLKIKNISIRIRDENTTTVGLRWNYIPSIIYWKIESKNNILKPNIESSPDTFIYPKINGSIDYYTIDSVPGMTGGGNYNDYCYKENNLPKSFQLNNLNSANIQTQLAISFWVEYFTSNALTGFGASLTTGNSYFHDTAPPGFNGLDLSSNIINSGLITSHGISIFVEYEFS